MTKWRVLRSGVQNTLDSFENYTFLAAFIAAAVSSFCVVASISLGFGIISSFDPSPNIVDLPTPGSQSSSFCASFPCLLDEGVTHESDGASVATTPGGRVDSTPQELQGNKDDAEGGKSEGLAHSTKPSTRKSASSSSRNSSSSITRILPTWLPRSGKFLLGYCHLNRWTNRLHCMQRALIAAVMLNRTLIVPSLDVCSQGWEAKSAQALIDVEHLRKCIQDSAVWGSEFGESHRSKATEPSALESIQGLLNNDQTMGVISLGDYLSEQGLRQLKVDKLVCNRPSGSDGGTCPPRSCNASGLVKFQKVMKPPVPIYHPSPPINMHGFAVLQRDTEDPDVLCLGDTFYTLTEGYSVSGLQSLAPMFQSKCSLLFKPTKDIFTSAEAFIRKRMKGAPFAALHFRRGDFQDYCRVVKCSFWSAAQAAQCVVAQMVRAGLKHLFLATDAGHQERTELGALLAQENITMHVYQPQEGWQIEEFQFLIWQRKNRRRRAFSRADLVEKVIAAKSDLLFHQDKSTFSYHIRQIRDGMGLARGGDTVLCAGFNHSLFVPPPNAKELQSTSVFRRSSTSILVGSAMMPLDTVLSVGS